MANARLTRLINKFNAFGDYVDETFGFHGHLGPFLVLGLKAGLLVNSLFGKDCFKTKAIVTSEPSPPSSCFVDGVQFVTGCTMGKRNIELRKGRDVSVLFLKENKGLRLRVKKEIFDCIRSISSEKTSEEASLSLLNKSANELFEVEKWKALV